MSSSSSNRPKSAQKRRAPGRAKKNAQSGAASAKRAAPPSSVRFNVGPKRLNGISPYLKRLAAQMIDPGAGSGSNPLITPDWRCSQVCVRHLRQVVDASQADYPQLKILMSPNLTQPGWISSLASGSIPAAGLGSLTAKGTLYFDSSGNMTSSQLKFVDHSTDGFVTTCVPIADAAAVTHPGLNVEVSTNCNFSYQVTNVSKTNAVQPKLTMHFKRAGNWDAVGYTAVTTTSIADNATVNGSTTLNANPGATQMGFSVSEFGGKAIILDVLFTWSAAQATAASAVCIAPAFPHFILDDKVTCGRVTSMSMLVTCTSSSLYNSGTINIGRVPARNFNYFSDFSTQMAHLPPEKVHTGAFATGGYTYWVPRQLDEATVDDLSKLTVAYNEADRLVAEIPDWVAGGTARITFDWIVEFYTPSMLFEKVPTPMVTGDFERLCWILQSTPCASCNPDHKELFKNVLNQANRIKGLADSAASTYAKYAPAINAVLEGLALLA